MRIFGQSMYRVDCERCGRQFVVGKGGTCTRCRTILCEAHLHGSFTRRLLVSLFGRPAVCVECRGEGRGAGG
jgi:ribosomal protein S27E